MGIMLGMQPYNAEVAPMVRSWTIGVMGFLIGLSIFGVATGIGLFLLRNWARISALIWAGLSVFFGLAGVVVIFFSAALPASENLPAQSMWIFRLVLAAIYGIPLFIGIWWLILLNRRAIKLQFPGSGVSVDPEIPPKPRCPTPVAVLAWIFIASGFNIPFLFFLPARIPMLFFGQPISGKTGIVFLIFILTLSAVIGAGLLKLKRWSYSLAIGMQFFGLANLLVSIFSPNFNSYSDSMLLEMEKAIPASNSGFQLVQNPDYFYWCMCFGIVCVMAVLGILLFYRTRFLGLADGVRS